jgi:hypothetical protein
VRLNAKARNPTHILQWIIKRRATTAPELADVGAFIGVTIRGPLGRQSSVLLTGFDRLPGPKPVKTANSGQVRLPIRPRAGPLDVCPIVGKRGESYGEGRGCQAKPMRTSKSPAFYVLFFKKEAKIV